MSEVIKGAEIAGELSHDDIRQMLGRAVDAAGYGSWIVDISASHCVVARTNADRKAVHTRYPYTIEGDAAKLGEGVEVKLSWDDKPGTVQAGDPDTRAFVTDLRGFTFSDSGPLRIEVCRDGTWTHPKWGEIKIDAATRQSFIDNFTKDVRKCGDLPLDYDHQPGPAPGWIKGLVSEGSSLFAEVELTPSGRQKVESGEYRFFSPEWHPNWEDPATSKKHGPTLFGGGLTNRPFFRGMAAINCSEPPPSISGGTSGEKPQEKPHMPDTDAGTQTFAELNQRIQAIEEENRTLRAAEDRRTVSQTFNEMRFNEGQQVLAPAARAALVDAVLPLPDAQRTAVVNALKGLQFVQLGEVGFTASEPKDPNVVTEDRKKELLAMTETGKAALG